MKHTILYYCIMVESKSNNANKKLTDDSRCQFNYKEYTVHIFVNFTKRQYAEQFRKYCKKPQK